MLYLHFPFCRSRCLYCGFYSTVSRTDSSVFKAYSDALVNEFHLRSAWLKTALSGRMIDTVYLGGGTPSLIPVTIMRELLTRLKEEAGRLWCPTELTIEVNPDDVTEERVDAWRDMGINRVSIGIQSLNDTELHRCGRRHSSDQARKALKTLKSVFTNISVDIIVGLPYQTKETLHATVSELLAMAPQHISAYMLEMEPDSPLDKLDRLGRIQLPDDQEVEERYMEVSERLVAAGYEHYEISNYAKPGYRSRHNAAYWTGHPYLGLGPGAASYDGMRHRVRVKPSLQDYIITLSHISSDKHKADIYEEEHLTDEQLRDEFLLTRLRRKEGFSLRDYESRFGTKELQRITSVITEETEQGYTITDGDNVALTFPTGILWADRVIRRLAMLNGPTRD